MRNNLDLIEKIDNYLTGKLSQEEKTQFETEIANNPELKATVATQKLVLQAIHRKGIRQDIKNVSTSTTGFWGWIIGMIIIVSVIALYFTSIHFNLFTKEKTVTHIEYNFNGLKTLIEPDLQTFSVDTEKGATIEGKDGTVVFIPTDAFVDQQGNLISGNVDFELVEALSLSDMVLYNLTTTADGKTLETGGMIYTHATHKNETVQINPERPLYVEIPTHQKKEGMMIFTGVTTPEGNLNWKDPKPLKKYLAQVDFDNLDFLPRGFEDKVREERKNSPYYAETKETIDSLYYTLSYHRIVYENLPRERSINQIDSLIYLCGLEPKMVKTIQTTEFKNTFIATKEFEQRIHELHKLEYARDYLHLYIHNLEKPLWKIDSLVANQLSGKSKEVFTKFADQKLTNIKEPSIHQKQLSAYYNKSLNEHKNARYQLRMELNALTDDELETRQQQKTPFATTLPRQTVATKNAYSFRVFQFGWANIDRYMKDLDENSKIVTFTCKQNIPNIKMYQWFNSINTLNPIRVTNNSAFTSFPSRDKPTAKQMENTYTIAITSTQEGYKWAMVNYNPYLKDSIEINLKPIKLKNLKKQLSRLEGNTVQLIDDIKISKKLTIQEVVAREEKAYQEMRLRTKPRREFELRVAPVTFPCEVQNLNDVDVKMVDESEIREIYEELF